MQLDAAVLGTAGGGPVVGDGMRLAAGLAAVGAGLTQLAFADGHPAEAVVPLLWVLAAVWARDDRVVAAGLLIGVSAGLELCPQSAKRAYVASARSFWMPAES